MAATFAQLGITADTSQLRTAVKDLQNVAVQAGKTEAAVSDVAPATAAAGRSMGAMGGQAKQLGWQLSQIAQQGAVTGQWAQAFAIQASDIAMVLGGASGVGLAIGVLASVSLPLLGLAFGDTQGATEAAETALEEYGSTASGLSSTFSKLKALQDEYAEAVKQGSLAVAAAISLEVRAQQAKMQLSLIDNQIAQEAAAKRLAEQEAEYRATSDKIALINSQILANKALQAEQDKAGVGFGGADYTAMIAEQQAVLSMQLKTLKEQKDALDRQSAEYAVIDAQVGVLNAKMAVNQDVLDAIAAGLGTVPPALDAATGSAGNLFAVLSDISNLSFSNLPGMDGLGGGTLGGLGYGNAGNDTDFAIGSPAQAAAMAQAEYSIGKLTGAVTKLGSAAGGGAGGGGGAAPQIDDLTRNLDDLVQIQLDGVQKTRDAQVNAMNDLGGAVNALTSKDIPGAITGLARLGQSLSGMGGMGGFGSALSMVNPFLGFVGPVMSIFDSLFGGDDGGGNNKARKREQRERREAQAAAQAIVDERLSLEAQVLQLEGNTVALRKRELDALEPANRALQQQIYALEDQAAAAEAAAQAAAELAAAQQAIADERYSLETQLLELQGDTATLRERELAQLDPSNRALQEQIWALQDAEEAIDGMTDSAKALADALDENMFATLLDYQVAYARTAYGAAGIPATSPVSVQQQQQQAATQASTDASVAILQRILDEVTAGNSDAVLIGADLTAYTKAQRDVLNQWNGEGLPAERT